MNDEHPDAIETTVLSFPMRLKAKVDRLLARAAAEENQPAPVTAATTIDRAVHHLNKRLASMTGKHGWAHFGMGQALEVQAIQLIELRCHLVRPDIMEGIPLFVRRHYQTFILSRFGEGSAAMSLWEIMEAGEQHPAQLCYCLGEFKAWIDRAMEAIPNPTQRPTKAEMEADLDEIVDLAMVTQCQALSGPKSKGLAGCAALLQLVVDRLKARL